MFLQRFINLAVACLLGTVLLSQASAEGISLARIPHIYEIAIDPAAPDHLILATPRGLYRLTPDIKMQPLLDDSHDVTSLVVSDNGKHLLASGKKQNKPFGVLISADAGKTWQSQIMASDDAPALRLMKVSGPKGRLLAVGQNLMQSGDAGKSWTEAGKMPPASLGLAASRKKERDLLAATAKGLMSSSDRGKSWQPVSVGPGGKPASMVARDGQDTAYTFIVSAGLYAMTRNGNWQRRATADAFDGALIHLTGLKSAPGRLIGLTQYMKILQSLDGGQTWSPFASR